MRTPLLISAALTCALGLTGCGGARPVEPVDVAGIYGATDIPALADAEWLAAHMAIADATGLSLPASVDERGAGVLAVLPAAGASLVVVGNQATVLLALTDGDGGTAWQLPLALGTGWEVSGVGPVTHPGLTSSLVAFALVHSEGSTQTLVVAIEAGRMVPVRLEDGAQQVANARVSATHPELALVAGDLTADAPIVDQLAALVSLAQPDAVRSAPGIRSNLSALAAGTDVWLATAAAEVLTLPAN